MKHSSFAVFVQVFLLGSTYSAVKVPCLGTFNFSMLLSCAQGDHHK